MTSRKRGLSAERHHEIGLELARMNDRLVELSAEIANAYPVKSLAYIRMEIVEKRLFLLRSELDNRFFAEYPDPGYSPYFPPSGTSGRPTEGENHHVR